MEQALGPGEFFGKFRRRHCVDGIVLSHILATGDVDPHVHYDAHFVLITGGRYISSATGEPDSGPVFIYNPPGTCHRDHFEEGRGSLFTVSLLPQYLDGHRSLPSVTQYVSNHRVRGAVFELIQECQDGPDSRLLIEGLCVDLLAAMVEARVERKLPPWLSCAHDFLHDHACENLSLASIARNMGVHPIHFTRAFRTFFGCAPGVYLRACRLQRAADQLRRKETSLCEIALANGFADQSHFTRRFTQFFGVPPGEYRQLVA